jgi:hypothetical protein
MFGLVVAEVCTTTYRRVGALRDSFPLDNNKATTIVVYKALFLENVKKVITIF